MISLADIVRHPQVFFHQQAQNSGFHFGADSGGVPASSRGYCGDDLYVRIAAHQGVGVGERLRLALFVAAIIALISLALDAGFFPRSLFRNGARWIGLALWTLYFSVSERVRRVF